MDHTRSYPHGTDRKTHRESETGALRLRVSERPCCSSFGAFPVPLCVTILGLSLTQESTTTLFLKDPSASESQRPPPSPTCLKAQLLEEITQLAHNKVLIAAGVSAAIGQLTKPVTSVILYGKDFDFKAIVQGGGFPSTHSSAVVATATTLGLERGLSDSICGLTDGVRREVGNHAKVLNKTLPESARMNSVPTKDRGRINPKPKTSSSSTLKLDSFGSLLSEEANSFPSKPTNGPLVSLSDNKMRQTTETQMSSGLGT